MPAVQRTLFGTAATSLKEYIPLNGWRGSMPDRRG